MGAKIRSIGLLMAGLLIMVGCNQFVPLTNLDNQPIQSGLTSEQISKAIRVGGASVGWIIKESGTNHMIGTLNIRTHEVVVDIFYTDSDYSIQYQSSNNMKVFCTEKDFNNQRIRYTGRQFCPNNGPPEYIHAGYKKWVINLNQKIQAELIRAS